MKRKAIFTRFGIVSYTPADFNCFVDDPKAKEIDLKEKERFLWSSDDCRLTEPELKHKIVEIEIPDWIKKHHHVEYASKSSIIGKTLRKIEYMTKNTRRKFYQSLKDWYIEHHRLTNKQVDACLKYN